MWDKVKKLKPGEEDWIDEDIYSEDFRESMVEDDEISIEEEAFMQGYDKAD